MKLLDNDRRLLNRSKLYHIMDNISPTLRIDESAEEVLLEFVNEYTENLMNFAMDMDSMKRKYQDSVIERASGVSGQQKDAADNKDGNEAKASSLESKEKFSDEGLLDLAQMMLDKHGLQHDTMQRNLFFGAPAPLSTVAAAESPQNRDESNDDDQSPQKE